MTDDRPTSPPPESAMGGASDSGAHGRHPASKPAVGDAAVERRRGNPPPYHGPERRQGPGHAA